MGGDNERFSEMMAEIGRSYFEDMDDSVACREMVAEISRICIDVEQMASKYEMGVMDVLNYVMAMHVTKMAPEPKMGVKV